MLTVLLIKKIISLFIIMLLGMLIVKVKVLSSKDSRILSLVQLYLLTPCLIISSFQVDYNAEISRGLALAAAAAVALLFLQIIVNMIIRKPLRLDPVEQVSICYSNAGNLIIPLVTAMLGEDWVIYTSAYIAVQQVLMWTHAKSVLCGERGFDIKKIVTNINMIAIFVGIILFFTGIRFPGPVDDAVDSLGSMIGSMAMLITGMLIGGMDLKKLFSYRRLWLVAGMRLVATPLAVLPLLKLTGVSSLVPAGDQVLLVTFMATMAPSASTITSMALIYGKDADYASTINVATTLLCILTMPVMVFLYTL